MPSSSFDCIATACSCERTMSATCVFTSGSERLGFGKSEATASWKKRQGRGDMLCEPAMIFFAFSVSKHLKN